MKTVRFGILALILALSTMSVRALTFNNNDLLLVFHETGYKDVICNLGQISQFLGKAGGTIINVNNFDKAAVIANFDGTLDGVKYSLIAATGSDPISARKTWLSNAEPTSTPVLISGSRLANQLSKILKIGGEAATNTANSAVQIALTSSDDVNSYTQIATDGGVTDISTLGGASDFVVEQDPDATVRFFQISATTVSPKPAATQIGSFALTSAGALTFTAGTSGGTTQIPQPTLSVSRSGTITTISFQSLANATYRLRYSSTLGTTIVPNWTTGSSVTGTGGTVSLTDDSTGVRFYAVEAF
ncbi:MAG: hypothetical protein JWN25_2512 [Verrucomicrobiales bacterium]|nr:hypothetical protein [Verrucomicrobiales bacterium]